jgi:hypothetical protein
MAAPPINQDAPLDFTGVDVIEHNGHTLAVCPGCQAWVRISKHYQASRLVMDVLPHQPTCPAYTAFRKNRSDKDFVG